MELLGVRPKPKLVVLLALLVVMVVYCLDVRAQYPRAALDVFDQPLLKLGLYTGLYALAFYDFQVALLAFLIVMCVHCDVIYMTLGGKPPNPPAVGGAYRLQVRGTPPNPPV